MTATLEPTQTDREAAQRAYDLDRKHVFHSWSAQDTLDPMVISAAEGSHLWDGEGNKYLDFSSQLVNTNIGHQHPAVVAAIAAQAAKLCTIAPSYVNDARSEAARLIAERTPGELDRIFFTNGGADANEHAVRMARLHTGRHKVLSAYRSYHGGTHLAVNITGDPRRWASDNGSAGTIHFFPPYLYRTAFHSTTEEEEAQRALEHLEQLIEFEGPSSIAAIMLESIPGTAGIYVPPAGYMQGVRELCTKYGIVFIADEVMAGFGRTGKWFAVEHFDVVPDLLTFAKGVNSGYVPLGGVAISPEIAATFGTRAYPGGLTYSGHPLATAGAAGPTHPLGRAGMVEHAAGLRTEDAPVLFERVLTEGVRDVVVPSISLSAIRRAMADAAPKPLPPVASSRGPAPSAALLNPVEGGIAEIWRELLGIDEVGRDDDFFALGGHSLAAVRLFARIRKQWNVDLPLATLFQGSTLSGLAAIVAEAGGLDTSMPSAPAPTSAPAASNVIQLPRAWSPLVAICRGAPDKRPLFCVHGAGGNVLNFKVISDRLGPQQPFYGLQAQGVDGRLPPLTSVEAMAAQYIEAIRTVDPTGPYRLAGYSGGGVIAYEMAQQLRREGLRVETIVMMDTLAPEAARRKVPLLQKLWLKRHWTLDFMLDWPNRRRRGREMQRQYQVALDKLARGEALPPELADFHLFRTFTDAQERYQPQPYDGDIVLLRAELAETVYLYAGPQLGWNESVSGAIRVTEIGGSHFSMMAEPGISEVIEAFRRELVRLDGEPPRSGQGGGDEEDTGPIPTLIPA